MSEEKLIDADAVAAKLSCAARTVFRLADAGRIPWGIKMGALRRWRASEIDAWIREKSTSNRNGS